MRGPVPPAASAPAVAPAPPPTVPAPPAIPAIPASAAAPPWAVPGAPAAAPPAGRPAIAAAQAEQRGQANPADLEADEDTEDDGDEMSLTAAQRLRRLSPALVILTAGSIASLVFLLRAVTGHTTPVAVLMSAAVVTGLVFGADAISASVVTWRASQTGDSRRALMAAIVGGVSSLVSLGAFAVMLVMILVLNS